MSKTDAAYMRQYRANKKIEAAMILVTEKPGLTLVPDEYVMGHVAALEDNSALREEVGRLEAEVRHLKEELAKRPPIVVDDQGRDVSRSIAPTSKASAYTPEFASPELARFNTRPFTPVPKKGR